MMVTRENHISAWMKPSSGWAYNETNPILRKHVSEDVFALACETLNQIIAIG
jgi:hypothetical protein